MLVQVTIAPRAGRELGYVRMKMDPMKFNEGMLTYVFICIVSISFLIFLKECCEDYSMHICMYFHSCFLIPCSQQSVLDHITVQLAPRAADEIWYGEDQVRKSCLYVDVQNAWTALVQKFECAVKL